MSAVTDKFREITSYDIYKFLTDYTYFVDNYYSYIVGYYQGEDIDKDSFNYLDYLNGEIKKIDGLWDFYSNTFELEDFWELLDVYDTAKVKLWTVSNLGRWLRSSRTDRFMSNTVVSYVQKQGESVEKITQKFGSINKDNDWVDVSIDNDLNEEKYTSQGGVILQIRLQNNSNFQLKNIVDYLTTDNLYGKDIQKKLELSNGDLVTLSKDDALMQTFETIMLTEKGSIPEFPEDGVSNSLIGSNISIFNYPSMFRSFMNMFQKDDRFAQLEIVDITREQDNIYMKLQAKTKIGTTLQQQILV